MADEYIVLARKYRSETFDEVVGQEPIATTLVNAIKTGRVAHAYLFNGTRGVGKTTMARIFAKALNCLSSDGPTPTPCNKCDACEAISRGDDVDTIEFDAASNRKVEEISELLSNAMYRPSRCRYKIYYIDEVHMLSTTAFNALLKIIEEPPSHVKFFFSTTEAEKLPATILSRCQRFDFRNIPTRLIADHLAALCKLEDVEAEGDALFRIARAAAGSMRDGLSLLDQVLAAGAGKITDADVVRLLGTPGDEQVLAIASSIAGADSAAALMELSGLLGGGISISLMVGSISDIFRNMMLAKTCGLDSELIELPEIQRKEVGELSEKFSLPSIVHAVGMLSSLSQRVRGTGSARSLVEAALVRLAEADKFVDPADLVARLERAIEGNPKKKLNPTGAAPSEFRPNYSRPPANAPAQPSQYQRPNASYQPPPQQRQAPPQSQPPPQRPQQQQSTRPQYQPTAPQQNQNQNQPIVPGPARQLSTSEKQEISDDPTIKKIMTLFEAQIVDMNVKPDTSNTGEEEGNQ